MRTPLLAVLTSAALVLTGCGGGDEPAPPAASGPASPAPSSAPSTSSPSALQPFEGDGFTASFPSTPERSDQPVDTPAGKVDVVLYQSGRETEGFVLSYFELPPGGGTDLRAAVAGAAQQVEGRVDRETETTYQDFPARDARITDAFGEGTIFTRLIATPDRLYQLQYVVEGTDVAAPPAEYQEFLDSLELTA